MRCPGRAEACRGHRVARLCVRVRLGGGGGDAHHAHARTDAAACRADGLRRAGAVPGGGRVPEEAPGGGPRDRRVRPGRARHADGRRRGGAEGLPGRCRALGGVRRALGLLRPRHGVPPAVRAGEGRQVAPRLVLHAAGGPAAAALPPARARPLRVRDVRRAGRARDRVLRGTHARAGGDGVRLDDTLHAPPPRGVPAGRPHGGRGGARARPLVRPVRRVRLDDRRRGVDRRVHGHGGEHARVARVLHAPRARVGGADGAVRLPRHVPDVHAAAAVLGGARRAAGQGPRRPRDRRPPRRAVCSGRAHWRCGSEGRQQQQQQQQG